MTEPDSGAGETGGTSTIPPTAKAAVPGDQSAAVRARWAVMGAFLVTGTVMASFFVRIPSLKLGHQLTSGELGFALLVPSLAALVAMQLAGSLVARAGSATVARLTATVVPISLLGVGLAGDHIQLVVLLLVFGAIDGLLDVSMNAHAIAVERTLQRPIMSACHAAWSIGAMIGSLLGGMALRSHLSPAEHYMWLAIGVVAFAAVTGRWMLPASADQARERAVARQRTGWRAGWSPRVVLLGGMGAIVLIAEAAVGNWSGVFLHENRDAALPTAALAYIGFTVCQTAGRLAGDRLRERYGAVALVRWTGVIAIAGLAMVVASPAPLVAIAGFAVLGVGLSAQQPVIFSAVGHGGTDEAGDTGAGAAAALSRLTTLTYSGLLLGPVLIGWLAEAFGLTWTLAGLLAPLLVVVLNARATAAADRVVASR